MRRLLGVTIIGLGVFAGMLFGVIPVSAHTPQVAVSCDTLTVVLTNYNGTNRVRVVIDGQTVTDDDVNGFELFGSSWTAGYNLDGGIAHSYHVVVIAHDDLGFTRGWSIDVEGVTEPCVTTTSMPSSTTTTGPSSTTTMPPEPTTTTIPSDTTTTTPTTSTSTVSSTTTTGPNGSSSSVVPPTKPPTSPPSLPYTGADTAILLMVGVGLLGLGSLALGWRKDTEG